MLNLPPSVRILLAREPADMRKGFDGLSSLVQGVLKEDPLSAGSPREIALPGLPQIRTCGFPASGSSSHDFAARLSSP